MTDLRKAAEMALEALEWSWGGEPLGTKEFEAMTALRQALAQPEQEPVAWQNKELPMEFYEYEHLDPMWHHHYRPLYTAPPSKPWVSCHRSQAEGEEHMNDRITKWLKNHLVNCEYTEFGWQECHRYEFDEAELKEYTELIVRECASLMEWQKISPKDVGAYNSALSLAQRNIKEHFGIESTIDDQLRSRSTYFGNNP